MIGPRPSHRVQLRSRLLAPLRFSRRFDFRDIRGFRGQVAATSHQPVVAQVRNRIIWSSLEVRGDLDVRLYPLKTRTVEFSVAGIYAIGVVTTLSFRAIDHLLYTGSYYKGLLMLSYSNIYSLLSIISGEVSGCWYQISASAHSLNKYGDIAPTLKKSKILARIRRIWIWYFCKLTPC